MGLKNLFKSLTTAAVLASADITTLRLPALSTAAAALVAATAGVILPTYTAGPVKKMVLVLTDCPLVVTDALAYASLQLIDFPTGRINVLDCSANLQFGVTTARSSTINDSASLTFALGTVVATSITLTSTMVDLLPKQTSVLSAATTVYNTAVSATLAASAKFDGTGTAKKMFLNVGFETNTDIDGDGTLKVSGTITLTYIDQAAA